MLSDIYVSLGIKCWGLCHKNKFAVEHACGSRRRQESSFEMRFPVVSIEEKSHHLKHPSYLNTSDSVCEPALPGCVSSRLLPGGTWLAPTEQGGTASLLQTVVSLTARHREQSKHGLSCAAPSEQLFPHYGSPSWAACDPWVPLAGRDPHASLLGSLGLVQHCCRRSSSSLLMAWLSRSFTGASVLELRPRLVM